LKGFIFSEMPEGDARTSLAKLHIAVASLPWVVLALRILWTILGAVTIHILGDLKHVICDRPSFTGRMLGTGAQTA